ncbi:MAG: NADH-quinone oxidoreductase subunit C [Acidimicrobiia bacterium]
MPDDNAREEIHEEDAATTVAIGDEVAAAVVERFPEAVFHDSHGQPVAYVDAGDWHDVAVFLRDEQRFTQCVDVTVVDHLRDETRLAVDGVAPERFEVVANYLSHPRNRRFRVITQVRASDPTVASLADVYPGVDFAEREAFDLFGIDFVGHPGLTRILMPDDWDGFPLRKDDAPARVPVTFKGDPGPR